MSRSGLNNSKILWNFLAVTSGPLSSIFVDVTTVHPNKIIIKENESSSKADPYKKGKSLLDGTFIVSSSIFENLRRQDREGLNPKRPVPDPKSGKKRQKVSRFSECLVSPDWVEEVVPFQVRVARHR